MNTLPATRQDHDYVMAEPVDSPVSPAAGIKLHKLLWAVRRLWWVPILTVLLGLGVAAAIIYKLPHTFVSKGKMWESTKLRLPEANIFVDDVQTALGTQSDVLQSVELRNQALAYLRENVTNLTIPLDGAGVPVEVPIRVVQSAKSSVFVLQGSGENPRYVQAYLDALMACYIRYKKDVRKSVSEETLASMNAAVRTEEAAYKAVESVFRDFQETNNLAVLQQEGTIAGTYLAQLKARLSDLELDERLLQLSLGTSGATNSLDRLMPFAASPSSSGPASAVAEQMAAVKELEVLKRSYERFSKNLKPQHPKMLKMRADIDRGEKLLALYRDQSRSEMIAAQQSLLLRLETVRKNIAEWETKVAQVNSRLGKAEALKLDLEVARRNWDQVITMRRDFSLGSNIDHGTLQVLEPASAPERTYSQEISVAGLSGVGGLGLGLGLIALVALRDDRFGSVREVTERFGNGVMGQVPEVQFNGSGPLQLHDQDQQHMYAESYRNIRSALLYSPAGTEKPKAILVTSALPSEGKTTVAANLAKTLALGGARVLLIDGDLRKGSLHGIVGLNQAPGFAELLSASITPQEAFQTNSLPNLRFIAAGKRISNAGDLFIGKRIDDLLNTWREQFDHIVIDSTPVFAADDASTLAPKMDGVVLVVRNRFSKAAQVREAIELLLQRQAKVLGIVYNRADAKARAYYYYKYKEYYAEKA